MKKLLIAATALSVSGLAVAGPSWTNVDLGYTRGDSGDEDTEGFAIRGSFGFADKWHARAEYADGEINGGAPTTGADVDGYRIAIGIHPAVTDNTDFVFELSYFDNELDFGGGSSQDSDGYGLSVGLRSMFTDNVELHAAVAANSGDTDSGSISTDFTDILVTAGGQYLFTDNIGLGVEANVGDGNAANFYVRWSF